MGGMAGPPSETDADEPDVGDFSVTLVTEGVERRRIEGIEVPITNPARTIVDCFRYRAKIGLDVARSWTVG